jgi:hypothetical protein
MNAEMHFFSTAVVGILLDWVIWILPIPVVGRLKLPQKRKWGLMGVLGLGGIACIVGVLRLVLVWHYAHKGEVTSMSPFPCISHHIVKFALTDHVDHRVRNFRSNVVHH